MPGTNERKREQWKKDWEEQMRTQEEQLPERVIKFFEEPGVVSTSVPIKLIVGGKIVGIIEPNEP